MKKQSKHQDYPEMKVEVFCVKREVKEDMNFMLYIKHNVGVLQFSRKCANKYIDFRDKEVLKLFDNNFVECKGYDNSHVYLLYLFLKDYFEPKQSKKKKQEYDTMKNVKRKLTYLPIEINMKENMDFILYVKQDNGVFQFSPEYMKKCIHFFEEQGLEIIDSTYIDCKEFNNQYVYVLYLFLKDYFESL